VKPAVSSYNISLSSLVTAVLTYCLSVDIFSLDSSNSLTLSLGLQVSLNSLLFVSVTCSYCFENSRTCSYSIHTCFSKIVPSSSEVSITISQMQCVVVTSKNRVTINLRYWRKTYLLHSFKNCLKLFYSDVINLFCYLIFISFVILYKLESHCNCPHVPYGKKG
jgi:hypothetical protein